MRLLTRYILIEFLRVFLLALAGMTVFMLLVGVAAQAIREGLSLGPVLQILPFILPESMTFSIPAASLLAACTVFGRLAGDNEFVAMKALGISPWQIIGPVFAVAFLISVAAVWVSDVAVSWGRPGVSRVVMNSVEQIAYALLQTRKSYQHDGFSITVDHVEDGKLIRPVIQFRDDQQGDTEFTVTAREARLRRSEDGTALSMTLVDAVVDGPGGIEGTFPGEIERVISLERPASERSPPDFPLREIPSQRATVEKRISRLESTMAAEATMALFSGDLTRFDQPNWAARESTLAAARYRRNRFITEPWRRWANSFSCLFFVVVGVPLATRLRHSDFVTSFFASFMPILLVYYPLMEIGVDRAKAGALPQYAVWLGNLVCLAWGMWLMRKVMRY